MKDSPRLLINVHQTYAYSDYCSRQLANQTFYTRLEITEDEQLHPTLSELFATIVNETNRSKTAKRVYSSS
jgi:hypothetical protein